MGFHSQPCPSWQAECKLDANSHHLVPAIDHGALFRDFNMAGFCVVLIFLDFFYYHCRTGSHDSSNQPLDCSVFSSTFWGQIGMSGTQRVPESGTVRVSHLGTCSSFSHKMYAIPR